MPEAKFENMKRGGSVKISDEVYAKMENRIKRYYGNISLINVKEMQIESYKKRLKRISEDYERLNGEIAINPDIKAVCYDKAKVLGGSLPSSTMDRQIESIFGKLENETVSLNEKIYLAGYEMRRLEEENDALREYINLLRNEDRNILEMKYGRSYSFEKIADEILMSKTNVYRRISLIIKELYLLIELKNEKSHL